MEQQPSFFKVILPSLTASQYLKVPIKFFKHVEEYVPGRAILRGPSGDCHQVKLQKDGNGIIIKDGWCQFFKAHMLEAYEFLVFNQFENMCFDVRIFGKNGLERVMVHLNGRSHGDETDNGSIEEIDTKPHSTEAMLNDGREKSGSEIKNLSSEVSTTNPCEAAGPTIVKRKRGRPRKYPDSSTFTCKNGVVKDEIIELPNGETCVKLEDFF